LFEKKKVKGKNKMCYNAEKTEVYQDIDENWYSVKRIKRFGIARLFIMVIGNGLYFLLVDVFHLKYWMSWIVLVIPLFFLNMYLYDKAFKRT
jgi:hypothetical protein